jgi:hypothetical protein
VGLGGVAGAALPGCAPGSSQQVAACANMEALAHSAAAADIQHRLVEPHRSGPAAKVKAKAASQTAAAAPHLASSSSSSTSNDSSNSLTRSNGSSGSSSGRSSSLSNTSHGTPASSGSSGGRRRAEDQHIIVASKVRVADDATAATAAAIRTVASCSGGCATAGAGPAPSASAAHVPSTGLTRGQRALREHHELLPAVRVPAPVLHRFWGSV